MRVMIVGQKWFGAEVLKLCLARGDDVVAVSVPRLDDRLAALAADQGIALCQVANCLDASWVPEQIDLIVCAHAHVFVTPEARGKARHGALGYHPSLLPRHRGRDALRWTLHMGDQVAGGTAYWLGDGADTGDIAAQDWCWVRPGDTAEALWRRDVAPMGLRLLSGVLGDLDRGKAAREPQDERLATWEPAFSAGRLSKPIHDGHE